MRVAAMSQLIEITKMNVFGNDFVIIDAGTLTQPLTAQQARMLSDRAQPWSGCDQVLLYQKQSNARYDYQIYNADGGASAQCGNGARCIYTLLRGDDDNDSDALSLHTREGDTAYETIVERVGDDIVLYMRAFFRPAEIPARIDDNRRNEPQSGEWIAGERAYPFYALSLGNPHAVIYTDDVDNAPVIQIGKSMNQHELFPNGVNVSFCQPMQPGFVKLRVFERGVGETRACGSGACATTIVAITHPPKQWQGHDDSMNQIQLTMAGGELIGGFGEHGDRAWVAAKIDDHILEGRWQIDV